MGLFDFITKSSSANASQTVAQTGNQSYTTQAQDDDISNRLVQTPFSDVKYPLPGSDLNLPNDIPQAQNYDPNDIYSQSQPLDPINNPQFNNTQTPAITQEVEMPTNFPQSVENTQDNNSTFLQYNPQFSSPTQPQESTMPSSPLQQVSAEAQLAQPVLVQPENSNTDQQLPETSTLEIDPNTTAEVAKTLNAPIAENPSDVEASKPAEVAAPVQVPTYEDQLKDTLIVGTEGTPNSSEQAQDIQTFTAGIPEIQRQANPVETTESTETPEPETLNLSDLDQKVEVSTPTAEIPIPATEAHIQNTPIEEENPSEIDLDKEIFNNMASEVKEEYNKDEEQVAETQEAEMPKPAMEPLTSAKVNNIEVDEPYSFKVFNNIGFVGLNVQNPDQQMSETLIEVMRSLATNKFNFVLDSGKGYGEQLLNKVVDYKDISITGAYLKPFYSDYSDEPKVKLNTENYSTAVFSNQDLKVRYLIKASDAFIMPETSGISNMSLLLTLLSNAYLYFGQHKPIILLGKNWTQVIEGLKSTMNFNEVESNLFSICETSKDVMSVLTNLDKEYSGKTKVAVHKVLDMRNESDESDYFVNNSL